MTEDLRRMADEAAIRRLTAYYSDAVTHLDAVRGASVYASDGSVTIVDRETVGREAIEAGMRESFASFRFLQMIEHGGLIQIDGDHAVARWSTIEPGIRHSSDQLNVIFGRYEDSLSRLPEGWRFTRRLFTLAGRTLLDTAKIQSDPQFYRALLLIGKPRT
jgi:SnoaL-like domain